MIEENIKKILQELPPGVELMAAAKARKPEEIMRAAQAGVKIVGENYVQEALAAFNIVGHRVKWHFIGHLQRNKVKKAVEIFDMIETVDSPELSKKQKFGIFPEDAEDFIKEISGFKNIKIEGLMTMGPMFGDPEDARPYFVETKKLFDKIKVLNLPGVEMKYLSMGMTNSYQIALEEGANIVRIGTKIFGPRG
jgi:uncharacterized pyridoxal phosphate-containing UPF0001 family protein